MKTHLKLFLSPFGSPGNFMSLLSVRRGEITDKATGVKFQSMANLVSQIVAVYQPKKDKLTLVACVMLSLTCKPANIVSLLIMNFSFQILLLRNFIFIYIRFYLVSFRFVCCLIWRKLMSPQKTSLCFLLGKLPKLKS